MWIFVVVAAGVLLYFIKEEFFGEGFWKAPF